MACKVYTATVSYGVRSIISVKADSEDEAEMTMLQLFDEIDFDHSDCETHIENMQITDDYPINPTECINARIG